MKYSNWAQICQLHDTAPPDQRCKACHMRGCHGGALHDTCGIQAAGQAVHSWGKAVNRRMLCK
jgi:hypothetical protein